MKNPLSKPEQTLKKGIAKAKQYGKKQIIIPMAIGLMGIGALTNPQEAKGQTMDTIWGQGIFATKNAITGENVPYVNVEFTPDTMQMITPDTTFHYQTNYGGIGEYNLPVGIDLGTGMKETKNKESQISVYPNPSSAFTIIAGDGNRLQRITIYNLRGEEVLTHAVNNAPRAYIDLSSQPDGIYLFRAITLEHKVLTGKLVKSKTATVKSQMTNKKSQNSPYPQGRIISNQQTFQTSNLEPSNFELSIPSNNFSKNLNENNHPGEIKTKESKETYTAVYKVKWSKEEWYTDSTTIELHEGINDPQIFYIQEKPAGTWRIEGIVRDGDSLIAYGDNGDSIPAPLAGVSAYLSWGETLLAADTTDSNGAFTFDSIPQNAPVIFQVGDKDGYYSYAVGWTTPGGLPNGVDSTRTDSVFNTLLKRQITKANGDTISALDIAEMNSDGTRYDTVYYWFGQNSNGVGFTNTAKSQINNDIHQLQITEHNVYTYVESPTPRPGNLGIKIVPGSNATEPGQGIYPTPLGEFYPTEVINMWLVGGNNLLGTWHEFKRATGYAGVTYYSIMRGDAPGYTEEDRKIAEKFIRGYLNMVYHVNTPIPDNIITSYIDLNQIRNHTGYNQ